MNIDLIFFASYIELLIKLFSFIFISKSQILFDLDNKFNMLTHFLMKISFLLESKSILFKL